MPKAFLEADNAPDAPQRFLLVLWLTIALTVLGSALVAGIVWSETRPIDHDESFQARFTLSAAYFYPEQPAKSRSFEIVCMLCPFMLILSHAVARFWIRRLSTSSLPLFLRLAIGLSWIFFLWCLSPIVYCPHPPLEGMGPDWLLSKWFFVKHDFFVWDRFLYLAVVGCLGFFLFRHKPLLRYDRLVTWGLLLVCVLLVPDNSFSPAEINDEWRFTYHFNVITHALAQVINGDHFLVQFPHIYGGYVEFLGPILSLFPRRIETLLLPFPLLHAIATLGLLLIARLVIRNTLLFLVTGLALLAVEFVITSEDPYYPYSPIRTLFPVLGLFAATLFFRRPTRIKYGIASCVAAMAPLWNLDTGMVLWLSWVATLIAFHLTQSRPLQALKAMVIQMGTLFAAAILFLSYLRIASGLWPNPWMLIMFQKLVADSGYMCLPILVPDAWMIIVTIYAIGLVAAFHFYWRKASSWKTHFVLMLSLMGIGLFSYFMGRSAESNLVSTSYPAVLLAGVLLDQTRALVMLKRLPRISRAFLLPLGLMLIWWALLLIVALPDLCAGSGKVIRSWSDTSETAFQTNAAFVQKWTKPGDKVFMLSDQSGFYYYLTDTVCPFDIPSPGELLLSKDMDAQVEGLAAAQISKLFVEQNFYTVGMYKADINQRIQEIILQHYRPVATSPTGQVTLYVPR